MAERTIGVILNEIDMRYIDRPDQTYKAGEILVELAYQTIKNEEFKVNSNMDRSDALAYLSNLRIFTNINDFYEYRERRGVKIGQMERLDNFLGSTDKVRAFFHLDYYVGHDEQNRRYIVPESPLIVLYSPKKDILMHELQHATDYLFDVDQKAPNHRNGDTKRFLTRLIMNTSAVVAGLNLINQWGTVNMDTASVSLYLVVLSCAAALLNSSVLSEYFNDPLEIRARRTQNHIKNQP